MSEKKKSSQTKKVTFNCPKQIYNIIETEKLEGLYSSITDAILTALREKFMKK